jgi:hypothetical protein
MMPATVQHRPEYSAQTPAQRGDTWVQIERNVTQAIGQHPHFRGRANTVRIEYRHDTLIITGRLPSFYLKQLLQEAVRQVGGVGKIDNRIDVICSDGLSSAPNQSTLSSQAEDTIRYGNT